MSTEQHCTIRTNTFTACKANELIHVEATVQRKINNSVKRNRKAIWSNVSFSYESGQSYNHFLPR